MKMTKVLLAVLCGMLCIGLVACASSGGAAAGGEPGVSVPATGEWTTYNDQESDGGSSTADLEVVEMEGMEAYKVTGNVTTQFQYGFAGFMVDPDEATLEALKTAKGISFKVLGDGKRYTLKFVTTNVKDYAYFESHFNTIEGEVQTITIPIRNFLQPSWGTAVRFNQGAVKDLEWQTHESWRPNTFELTVWDVQIQQ